jgi:hypothetical protein
MSHFSPAVYKIKLMHVHCDLAGSRRVSNAAGEERRLVGGRNIRKTDSVGGSRGLVCIVLEMPKNENLLDLGGDLYINGF